MPPRKRKCGREESASLLHTSAPNSFPSSCLNPKSRWRRSGHLRPMAVREVFITNLLPEPAISVSLMDRPSLASLTFGLVQQDSAYVFRPPLQICHNLLKTCRSTSTIQVAQFIPAVPSSLITTLLLACIPGPCIITTAKDPIKVWICSRVLSRRLHYDHSHVSLSFAERMWATAEGRGIKRVLVKCPGIS